MNKIVYASLLIGLVSTATAGFAAKAPKTVGAIDPTIAQNIQADAKSYLGIFQNLNTQLSGFDSTSIYTDYGTQYNGYASANDSLQANITACLDSNGNCLKPIADYPNVKSILTSGNETLATAVEYYKNLPAAGSPTEAGTLQYNIAQFQQLATTIEAQLTAIQNNIVDYSTYYNNANADYTTAAACTSNECTAPTPEPIPAPPAPGATKAVKR